MNMGLIYILDISHPRPHCAFPWLLDKLRSTQAIVTAVSHFLVLDRVRILRIGQHTPTKNFKEYPLGDLKPGSKFPCQRPLANYASVNSSCTQPFPRLLRGICPPCQSRGWGICRSCAFANTELLTRTQFPIRI